MRYLAKKNYHIEEESEGSWAISYGDMITLLLSFFVIFFTTDLKKEKVSSMNNYLSFSMEELRDIPAQLFQPGHKSTVKLNEKEFSGLDIKIHQANNKVMISFGRFSFFNSGSTEVKKEGAEVLKKFVDKYLPYAGSYNLSIKGFTDKVKVGKGRRFQDNLELSALRSISAMRIMQRAGIPLARMEIAGAGELSMINEMLPEVSKYSESEKNNYSRTIMIVISPEKESWL